MARFARLAPGLDLDIAQPAGDNVRRVADGAADLAVGVFDALPASLYRRALYEDRLACVLRAGHPDAAGLDLDGYLALRHIVVTISGVGASPVDAALSARGLTRRVALRVPHFLAAAMMTADSDMALTLRATGAAAGGHAGVASRGPAPAHAAAVTGHDLARALPGRSRPCLAARTDRRIRAGGSRR